MNLLSHYYLERHPSPYRKLGALLPDLIYQFNRKVRKEIFAKDVPAQAEHRHIYEGIQSHYATDAFFHNSDFFHHYTRLILQRIKELPLPTVTIRSYFLAHVFLELMLDRLLTKQFTQLPVQLYTDLESVNPQVAASFFARVEKTGILFEFFNNFNRLLNARHLLLLSDNEMFVTALLRAYHKINPAYPSREEAQILMDLTDEIETEHRHHLLGIFEAMRNHPAYA